MSKNKLFRGTCLALAASVLTFSQVAKADVSISGWINQGVTYADDGESSDIVSTADNGATLGSRLTFAGSSDLPGGITGGFEVIVEPRSDFDGVLGFGSLGAGAATPDGLSDGTGDTINILGHSLFVSGNWGKLTFGLQSMPTDNIAVLADPSLTLWSSISPVFRGNNINLRGPGGALTGFVPGDFMQCFAVPGLNIGIDCNGIYRQGVRYDLPTFIDGLGLAVGWANDDVYDVAAKWNGDLGRMKAILHLGYARNAGVSAGDASGGVANIRDADNFQLQAGLSDPVTGLFGTIAYQNESADLVPAANAAGETDDSDAWWLKVGIKKGFTSLGDTALAFQYGSYNDQYLQGLGAAGVTGSELERIGVEINQYFGSSLIIYGVWENLEADADGTGATVTTINSTDDVNTFTLGLTYFF